jgi:hypothetical protein
MKKTAISLLALALAGCATGPAPNYIAGHYYMAGDSNCKSARLIGDTQIMCQDANGRDTGYRNAMSSSDVLIWNQQQQMQAQQMQAMSAQLAAQNAQQSAYNAQLLNSVSQYRTPQVGSYQQPSNIVRCISTDVYTNCRY